MERTDRLVDLLPRYERAQLGEGRLDAGVAKYVSTLRRFFATLGDGATFDDLTRLAVLDYRDDLAAKGRANSTLTNYLASVASFCEWGIDRELIKTNPARTIRRPPKKDPAPEPLHPEQIAILLEAIREPAGLNMDDSWYWRRNRRSIHLMLYGGLRFSEVRLLTWQRVHLASGIIDLREGTKGGTARRVAIHPDLDAELTAVPEHERQPGHAVAGKPTGSCLSRGGMEHLIDRWLVERMNIDEHLGTHLHAHKLRATFATYFAWSGGHVLTLQALLGHKDPRTTLFYVLIDDEAKRQSIAQLRWER